MNREINSFHAYHPVTVRNVKSKCSFLVNVENRRYETSENDEIPLIR